MCTSTAGLGSPSLSPSQSANLSDFCASNCSATDSQECYPTQDLLERPNNSCSATNLDFLSIPSSFQNPLNTAIYSFDWSGSYSHSSHNFKPSDALDSLYPGNLKMMKQNHERDHRWNPPDLPPPIFWSSFTHAEKFHRYIKAAGLNAAVTPAAFPSTEQHVVAVVPTSSKPVKIELLDKPFVNNRVIAAANANPSKIALGRSLHWVVTHLFSDSKLPVPFNPDVLTTSEVMWTASPGSSNLSHIPDLANDAETEKWFNHLRRNLGVLHGLIPAESHYSAPPVEPATEPPTPEPRTPAVNVGDRSFTLVGRNRALSGGLLKRKPDLVLVDHSFRHKLSSKVKFGWSLVQAIVEVTSDETRSFPEMLTNFLEKAANVFDAQLHRRHLIGLILKGKAPKIIYYLVFVDRVGAIVSQPAVLSDYDSLIFARIVFALCFGNDRLLGMDTRVTIERFSGKPMSVIVNNKTFRIITQIFSSPVVYSRGTRVYIVSDENDILHIFKDSWKLKSHTASEIDHISKISQIVKSTKGLSTRFRALCPRFVAGQNNLDCTDEPRGVLPSSHQGRLRCWAVTGPIGDPITSYRSRVELLQAFIDVAERKYFNCLSVFHGPPNKCPNRIRFLCKQMRNCPRRYLN